MVGKLAGEAQFLDKPTSSLKNCSSKINDIIENSNILQLNNERETFRSCQRQRRIGIR